MLPNTVLPCNLCLQCSTACLICCTLKISQDSTCTSWKLSPHFTIPYGGFFFKKNQIYNSQINHSFTTFDLHNIDASMKLLTTYILFPANLKETKKIYYIFPGCVSILIQSEDVRLYKTISIVIERTRLKIYLNYTMISILLVHIIWHTQVLFQNSSKRGNSCERLWQV